jgi:hypothetical protein
LIVAYSQQAGTLDWHLPSGTNLRIASVLRYCDRGMRLPLNFGIVARVDGGCGLQPVAMMVVVATG